MSTEPSAFESGFLGDREAPTARTGEYRLGEVAAELLAREQAPEVELPDEMTIKRRMRALNTAQSNTIALKTRSYPLAAAAALAFVAILAVTQLPMGSRCGELGTTTVISCGADYAALAASIEQSFPGDSLIEALRTQGPVVVPVHRLGLVLDSAEASFAIVKADRGSAAGSTHGLVLATDSELEFDRVRSVLAETVATVPVADELTRLKQEETPNWGQASVTHTVISLVNLN